MIFAAMALALASDVSGQVVHRTDPITDEQTVMAAWGDEDGGIALVCAPAKKALRVAFLSGRHPFGKTGLLNSAWKDTYRFDSNAPVTKDWIHSDDVSTLFESGDIIAFVRELASSSKFVMRARTFYDESFDVVIPLQNTKAAAKEVIDACGDTKVRRGLGGVLS